MWRAMSKPSTRRPSMLNLNLATSSRILLPVNSRDSWWEFFWKGHPTHPILVSPGVWVTGWICPNCGRSW
jgi:hypothetical protein